jgi:hypothetical protein
MQWLKDRSIGFHTLDDNATVHRILRDVLFGELDRPFVDIGGYEIPSMFNTTSQ